MCKYGFHFIHRSFSGGDGGGNVISLFGFDQKQRLTTRIAIKFVGALDNLDELKRGSIFLKRKDKALAINIRK